MEGTDQEQPEVIWPQNLPPEDKRNFVGLFELLLKVDKRVNPHLYQQPTIQQND